MFNRYLLDSDTLQNLNKRSETVKKLARQMILESKVERVFKLLFKVVTLLIVVYCVNHYFVFDHIFHIHQPH